MRRFWEGFEKARLDVHEVVEGEDGRVMVAMTMSGRGQQSEAETSWDVFQVWTIKDGKAIRGQGFMNREDALDQLTSGNE